MVIASASQFCLATRHKCESASRRFQPGEGPSRGLLRDCETNVSFNSTDPGPADERRDLQAAELLAPRQQQQVPQHPAQAEPPHHQPLHHQPGATDQPSLSDERWDRTENILQKYMKHVI